MYQANTYHDIFDELEQQGWSASDELFSTELLKRLLHTSHKAWRQGLFSEARVGSSSNPVRDPTIRGDTICWLEPATAGAIYQSFQEWADDFQQALNRHFYLGLRRSEFHFARYEPGTGYSRHVDQHQGQPHRKISLVLYLNPDWDERDGGQLCLYDPHDIHRETHRILPRFGRTVVFRSDLIPHEVRPARRTRWSLTGWFRNDSTVFRTAAACNDDDPDPLQTEQAA